MRSVDEDHFQRIACEINLASCQSALGQLEDAIVGYRSTLERFDRLLPDGHAATARVKSLLAQAVHRQGDLESAEELLLDALRVQRDSGTGLQLADSLVGIGAVWNDLHRPDEAESVLLQGIDTLVAELATDHWSIGEARLELAAALLDSGRTEEAMTQFDTGMQLFTGLPPDDLWLQDRVASLSEKLTSQGSDD